MIVTEVWRLTNLDEGHGLQNIGQWDRHDKCAPRNAQCPPLFLYATNTTGARCYFTFENLYS